jgi:outer membrane protein assembly factor BamD
MKLFKKYSATDLLSFLLVLGCLLTFSGCAEMKDALNFTSIDEDGNVVNPTDPNLPAKTLLLQGMDDYNVGKYFTAIKFFEDILNRFPFSPEATLAELKSADCSYLLGRYQEALLLYEEFENRHPTNESIPYVMFQKAMCNYKQIDRIDRDTAGAIKSIELFKQLVKAYPNSPYTEEAKKRIATATNFLADHEYFVVEYYVRTAKYDQAIVRLKYLLAMYPETDIAPQATELLTRIEAGDPPRSRLFAWFPKITLPDWAVFGESDVEDSAVEPPQY